MRTATSGFTLLEVLIALTIVTIGLLGLAGTLGPITRLAGQGRMQGRAALALANRSDLLLAELLAGAPGCAPPASGSLRHPDGITESWTSRAVPAGIEVRASAGTDTLVTLFPCP